MSMRYLIAMATVMVVAVPTAAKNAGSTVWLNRQMTALVERQSVNGWNVTESGLRWRRIQGHGGGLHPTLDDEVSVHYVGSFADGRIFDSSVERGEPAKFPLFLVIEGWQEGVQMMGVGDKFEFAIPYQLGYGALGNDDIPGGATLLFTIELLDVKLYKP